MNEKIEDKKQYLENILGEVEKSEESFNRLMLETKMRRNHNISKLRDIRDFGAKMNWKDETGLLEQINSLFQ